MAKWLRVLQEIDGSHRFDEEVDGKLKTRYVKFKYDAKQTVYRENMPPGLADKLIGFGYAVDVDDTA